MSVEFVSLKRAFDCYAPEYEAAALRALRSGWYILGRELEAFEKAFASFTGSAHCIGLGNGQEALILALRALGIGPGDEVITQANGYIASVLGITENGATPIFVEPDGCFGLDPEGVEAAITPKTRAILCVHLYGQACDMGKLTALAQKHGLYLIEDCAQSHGACWQGKMTGTFGHIGCFSFYPTKPIGAMGDAGACVTEDPILADRLRKLRNYGSGKKYVNEITGGNSRLDELQAALLQVSLAHFPQTRDCRARIAGTYLAGITNPRVTLPKLRPDATHVWHIFPVLCPERDALAAFLAEQGIHTSIHYPIPPHLQQCYAHLGYGKGDFPIAESQANQLLSLPIYHCMPQADVEAVIDAVNRFGG